MNKFDFLSIPGAEIVKDNELAPKTKNPSNFDFLSIPGAEVVEETGVEAPLPIQNQPAREQRQSHEYTGQNPVAAFAKNVGASVISGIPDLGVALHNVTNQRESFDPYTGETFSQSEEDQKDNEWPYVTDMISNAIDKATGGYTKDTGPMSKYVAHFLGSLFGAGAIGTGVKALGAANKLGKASEAVEATGSFIANHLGLTSPTLGNIAGATAAGITQGALEQNYVPVALQIPAVLLSFILAGKTGNKIAGSVKDSELVKSLFKDMPGVQKYLQKENYQDLARNINPEAINDLIKTSLIEKETGFLAEKTISELPQEIQVKLKENPALLNDQEVNLVVEKGMQDFNSQIERLEKEYDLPLTTGEYTGSPKILAKEDALANKPNIEEFDIAKKNRNIKIIKRLEKVGNDLSSTSSSSEKLGEKIAKEVDSVYKDAVSERSNNWNKNFGDVVDEKILPINGYRAKLKEFSKLHPDNIGSEVAISAANKRLKSLGKGEKISPKRLNDILVGLNEDIRNFPKDTFSHAQINELKAALESDLTKSIEGPLTSEQASMVRKARTDFASDSRIINQIDESILFNKIGKDALNVPEKITKSLDNMPASQLRLTFDAMKRSPNHQHMIPEIQKYYLEQAVKAATKGGIETFNPKIFLDKLPKRAEFEVIFGDTKAYGEIKDIAVLLRRMAKFQPSRSNSRTAQRAQADRGDLEEGLSEAAIQATKGNWFESLSRLFKSGDGSARDKKIAELLISPQHRAEILKQIGKPRNSKKTAVGVNAFINSMK